MKQLRVIIFAAALTVGLVPSLGHAQAQAGPDRRPTLQRQFTPRDVPFRSIEKGQYGGISQRRAFRIRTEDQWRRFWNQLHANITPQPIRPQIDFSRFEVIGVVAGEKSTGGYDIQIIDVDERGSYVRVSIRETVPGPDCVVTQAITKPYHLIVMPIVNKPLYLPLTQTALPCD